MANFFERLQAADDTTKKRWIVGISAGLMVIVVFLWFSYFNTLIVGFGIPAIPDGQEEQAPESSDFTFLETVGNGAAVLFHGMQNVTAGFFETITGPREYRVTPQE